MIKEYQWVNSKRMHICDTCCHKLEMTKDLKNSICADCGKDNNWKHYIRRGY